MTVQTIALQWDQVCAWRLAQHHLLERAPARDMLQVVSRVGGIQAQLMPAALLALAARCDGLDAASVEAALWQERTLVKTWVLRGTLHLIATADLPLLTAARSFFERRRPPSFYRYHEVTPEDLDAIIEGVPEVLSGTPITREQLATALAERAGNPQLREVLLSGWGSLLKPSAFRGDLCFGPNRGQHVTFVRPDQWIGAWQPADPETSIKEIARRYLNAFGPANPDDFARWWGIEASQARQVFRMLGAEIQQVDVQGWPAWCLAQVIDPLKGMEAPQVARLLPQFDAYTLGIPRDVEEILPAQEKSRVYRAQGWVSAVILENGRIIGTWEPGNTPAANLRVEFFQPPTAGLPGLLVAEERRLARILSTTHIPPEQRPNYPGKA